MSEVIERGARMLAYRSLVKMSKGYGENADHSQWVLDRPEEVKRYVDGSWGNYVEDARVVVESLIEPTVAMLDRGVARSKNNDDQLCDTDYGMVFVTYRAMIDEALR